MNSFGLKRIQSPLIYQSNQMFLLFSCFLKKRNLNLILKSILMQECWLDHFKLKIFQLHMNCLVRHKILLSKYLMDMSWKEFQKILVCLCIFITLIKRCSPAVQGIWELFSTALIKTNRSIWQQWKLFSTLLTKWLHWRFLKTPKLKPSKQERFSTHQKKKKKCKPIVRNWKRRKRRSWENKRLGLRACHQKSKRERTKKEKRNNSTKWSKESQWKPCDYDIDSKNHPINIKNKSGSHW